MKFINTFTVILILSIGQKVLGADVLPKNCIEEQILDALAKWRNGTVSPSMPSLQGIKVNSVDGLYEGFGIKIRYRTGEMKLSGVENFSIEQLSVAAKDLEASATVRFPVLTLTSDNYNLKGRAYVMYHLKGSGRMNVKNVQIDLEDSSWPINTVLNSNAMQILESYRSEMVVAAKDMLKQAINGHLATTISPQLLNDAGNNLCNLTLSALYTKINVYVHQYCYGYVYAYGYGYGYGYGFNYGCGCSYSYGYGDGSSYGYGYSSSYGYFYYYGYGYNCGLGYGYNCGSGYSYF
uniref:SFRICE_000447 n=1 Tax=Spodoptera frugiperda TaxID=7108 RepID=A0A2H1WUP3_SPOFR